VTTILDTPSTTVAADKAERFEILELLGRGGMGEVYKAWDRELEVPVALKSLRPSAAHDPAVVARFRREAKLARRIKHLNVAQMHDLVEIARAKYLCMEYVDGKSLRGILDSKRAVPVHVALGIMRQVCGGVQAAHDVGVIHRDLKPHNVMITRKHGRACILDFGIAREVGAADSTEAGIILGSPQYLSYDQLAGQPVTAASDVYQLGILLYEMVTGVSPFRAPGASAAALRALREIPPDPRQHERRIPQFLADVILRCLSRFPDDRPQSPVDLWRAIEAGEASLPPPDPTEVTAVIETDSGTIALGANPSVLLAAPPGPERDDMADRLARLGCDVTVTSDGLQALDRANAQRYSLAVLAAGLPQLDGLTACQLMRRMTASKDTPVVMLLDGQDGGREAFARQVGASDVIHTPLNVHAFMRSIRSLLGGL
jgi:serine/threonine-protein kinase